MIMWGGFEGTYTQISGRGAAYDPPTDAWQPLTPTDAPSPRYAHTGVWSGSQMIIWGGRDGGTFNTGGRFTP
jgi:hypothetical protein